MAKYNLPKIEELLDAGVHFGHQTRRWNPRMEPYIYGVKKNIHIIDLEKTENLLKEAAEFLYNQAKEGKQIVFVGTKKQARNVVEVEAKRCGAFHVTERWIGGTITNFKVIKRNIDKLVTLMRQRENGELEMYTKKERLLIDREIEKLQRNIGGIVGLKGSPDVLFIIDSRREKTAIREAKSASIPVVGLIDTNCDPAGIKHVVPGNDDAIKSISVILSTIADAIEQGYKDYSSQDKESKVSDETAKVAVVDETVTTTEEKTTTDVKGDVGAKPAAATEKPTKKSSKKKE